MCDTTKSTSKDDEDIDIYSELPNFKYDENLLKLEEDNKALKSKVAELMNKLKSLETQLQTCEKTNAIYRRNISMLFLSAKREIQRKDRTISELRSKSFHEARRDFPRRTRNEAVGRRNIPKNLEDEKTRPPPATSEPPVKEVTKNFRKKKVADNETSEQCALNDRNSDIPNDLNNQNLESGSQFLPNESEEILPKLDVNPSISESDKENQSENELMNAKNAADDKNPSYQDSDRSTDKSEKLISSESSAENVPAETNCADNGKSDEEVSSADCTDPNLLTNNKENQIPVISITICDTPESVSDSLKESVKEIESCVSESIEDLNQITEIEKGCQADGEKPIDDQDSIKITCNEKSVDDHDSTKMTNDMNLNTTSCSDLQVRNEGSSKDSEKEACSNENASEQLKFSTNTSQQENENVVLSCANVLLSLSTEFEFSEGIEGDKTCCEASSNNMKLSSEIGESESSVEVQEMNASSEELNASSEKLNASSVEGQEKNAILDELNDTSVKNHGDNATVEKMDESILEEQGKNSSVDKLNESGVEGQENDTRVENLDDVVVHTEVKGQETVGDTNLKEVLITDCGFSAFEKSDTPEIDDPPADKSDSKLTVEKPRIIDNISSSLHTFNSALDFSISTTNTNSLNADNIFEQQRQKAQLSESSLQVVNALKKLPKIRENFLQLFGESSNQENLKDSETGTPSKENDGKQCSTAAISKELKSLSCSSSLSSSSTSSSSMSSSSSFRTREKSSESAIPQVIRLFGIDITEEHSPFHVCKSSSQNSIMEEKVDEISHSTDTKRCRKTSTDRPTEGNKSETVTSKTNTVVVIEQVDAVLEKKSVKTDCSLTQVVIESKKISETKIVESQGQNLLQEKPVISKEIICEEPVIFPVPIIIVDKASDDKSGNKKASSQDNRATGEYYSNFTEALRNETNVSIAKTDVSQPEFQFESPSRYIMRINSNSVTSHKGFDITQSQSITGEDTLTMVDQPKSVPEEEMKTNLDFIAKKDKVSVSLSSEHFEFRKRRSSRPVVKINRSSLPNKQEVDKSKAVTDEQNKAKVNNTATIPLKSDKQAATPENDKLAKSPKNNISVRSPINDKQAVSPQDDKSAKSLKRGAKSPKSVKQNLGKHSITSSKKGIKSQMSPSATRQDSIQKQPLSSPSPRSNPTKEKSTPEPARKESIEEIKDKKHLSSVRNALNQLKRPLVPSRNDSIQRTQGFKRRRVVINPMAQNDLIKLGSKPTNETPKVENSVRNCETTNIAKDASPIASSSGLERLQSSSGSADSKPSLKRINDGSQLGPAKLMKLDNCVVVARSKDSSVTGKVVDESKTSQQRHRNAGKFDSRTRSTTKVSDAVRSSNRSGLTDVKSDVCERRSPSEYFNRSINRRYRGLLRDRKLRGRSPLVSRRRVDKNMMNMRETRERGDNRTSARVAERSVDNDVQRSSTLNFVEWKLKPIDFRRQRIGSLFERLVSEKVLEKLDKPRTYIRADPGEATPPPMVVPCSNDNRVLVDQANRSNQILSSPDLSNRSSQATNHPDTPKSTNNTLDPATSEIISPKPASQPNKVVIIRRRSNNAPKVLGDSVGTFVKTSSQVVVGGRGGVSSVSRESDQHQSRTTCNISHGPAPAPDKNEQLPPENDHCTGMLSAYDPSSHLPLAYRYQSS
ncbi:serine-rich adhesin for platelets-like [Nilaparvata lugens]|uniref:serine-rich adhesin for platelets-like n=1 Tax=Nilaparvata lugens TaxID=108931 RepID=UPI00193DC291|nr:serine-rich adhesin for platelets-like [Nilaparvata lugens]